MEVTIVMPPRSHVSWVQGRSDDLGGIEAACIHLAQGLAARAHQVTLVTPRDSNIQLSAVIVEMFDRLNELSGDAILACNDARLLTPHFRVPVLWMHNPLRLDRVFRRRQVVPLLQYRPHAVFGGPYAQNDCSRLLPFSDRRHIPLGLDPIFFDPLEFSDSRRHFIWVSQAQRGLALAVKAWTEIYQSLPVDTEFQVYGASEGEIDLPRNWHDQRIRLMGRVSKQQLRRAYQDAIGLICLGARDETFCLAAAEASASAVPVITLGIGSLRERVFDGVNGLVVRPDQLASSIAKLASDRILQRQLGEGGLRVTAQLSWDNAAAAWESFLLEVTQRKISGVRRRFS